MKTLVWLDNLRERSGGPPTYIYNLKKSVDLNDLGNTVFFSSDFFNEDENTNSFSKSGTLKKVYRYIPERLRVNLSLRRFFKWIDVYFHSMPKIDYSQYDIIHFHSTVDLYRSIKHLENFKGKVLLTSHTPKAPFLETIEDVLKSNSKTVTINNLKKIISIDEKAFERADYLIFPCRDAMEPYFNTWSGFGKIIAGKKVDYILTACPPANTKRSADEIRRELGIPPSAIVFVYAGRHNEVKGYDILKKAAEIILKKNLSVYFLILGKEEPLQGLQHPNWIEIGWTNVPHDYINAGDVFVLPNRETYFDLILLEVLSLQKPVILSNTGGNKYFLQNSNEGFFYFEDIKEEALSSVIEMVSKIPKTDLDLLGKSNYTLYKENFTIESFANNYLTLLNKIK